MKGAKKSINKDINSRQERGITEVNIEDTR